MRPLIVAGAKASLGNNIQVKKTSLDVQVLITDTRKVKNLSDLREDEDEVSASQQQEDLLIVGTVFKQQERKPSILKELSEPSEDGKLVVTDLENYCKSTTN